MKAFIFDLINKLQRTSNTLDAKAILCNKTWRVFSDTGEKEVYIFMEDGKLSYFTKWDCKYGYLDVYTCKPITSYNW